MSKRIYKYKNLTQLKAAYESGELSQESKLVLGDHVSHVTARETAGAEVQTVYFGKGGLGISEEALTLLGIPWIRF